MKKYILILFTALVCTLSGCVGSSNNDYVTTQDFTNCFAYIQNNLDGTSSLNGDLQYRIKLNYSDGTATVSFYNFKMPNGTVYSELTLPAIAAEQDKTGWITVKSSSTTPTVSGQPANFVMNAFQMTLLQRSIAGEYQPAFYLTFSIDDYTVFSSRCNQIFGGTTTTLGMGEPFSSKATFYKITLDPKKSTATIGVNYAQFADKMPTMSFELRDIPVIMTYGAVRFDIAEITPYVSGAPYESFPITNLQGNIAYKERFSLSFKCTPKGEQFGGASFDCSASCTYLDLPSNE